MVSLKRVHRSTPTSVKPEPAINQARQSFDTPLPRIDRRLSDDGNLLPIIGLVVDEDIALEVSDPASIELDMGALRFRAVEGVVDDEWQMVILRRLYTGLISSHVRDYASMKALHLLGVRQVLSTNRAHFEFGRYAHTPNVVELDGGGELLAGTALSMCPRLSTALTLSAESTGFTMLSNDVQIALTGPTRTEAVAAATLGMCYAALDVVQGSASIGIISAKSALTLRRAPRAISPLSTCGCQTRSTTPRI